jgi:hypothetical protein
MIRPVLNLFFGRRLARHTSQYLDEIGSSPIRASREAAARVIGELAASSESKITIGRTEWDQQVVLPVSNVVTGHSLITGASGTGKTRFALGIVKSLIEQSPEPQSFGILDAKGELFAAGLALLIQRLNELSKTDATAAEALRRRIVVMDFSSRDPISPYNILAQWPNTDAGFFAESRADLLLDLLSGADAISLGGTAVLRRVIMLLAGSRLPITWALDVFNDESLRAQLVKQSTDAELRKYFTSQFSTVPKQTIAALSRRLEALFSSEAVRLALSGKTAPDFRALQDDGRIVLVNCSGKNLSRSVRRLLQAIVLSDISQAVFARLQTDRPFLWICDEAQNFFLTPRLRDHMHDLLTMSRSFGSFLACVTQNISAAVPDPRLLQTLFTNIRWSFSMRGEPSDSAFLKPVLPVTGRKLQPQTNPFEISAAYSLTEERAMELNAIAHLPDRTGYFWLRPRSGEAIKITTQNVVSPQGDELNESIRSVRDDATFGLRVSRKEYDNQIAERNRQWRAEPPNGTFALKLAESYERGRGKS